MSQLDEEITFLTIKKTINESCFKATSLSREHGDYIPACREYSSALHTAIPQLKELGAVVSSKRTPKRSILKAL